MINLRPHHLMCTQGYSGKGYNQEFIKNMNDITNTLRNKHNTMIKITFGTDDICNTCPNMLNKNCCTDNDKVDTIDKKMIAYFNLEEKEYHYKNIVSEIKSNITEKIMDDICSACEWYKISSCKKQMLNIK